MSTARRWLAVARERANGDHVSSREAPFFLRAWGTSRFSRGGTHGSPASPLLGRKAYGFPTPIPAHGPSEDVP